VYTDSSQRGGPDREPSPFLVHCFTFYFYNTPSRYVYAAGMARQACWHPSLIEFGKTFEVLTDAGFARPPSSDAPTGYL